MSEKQCRQVFASWFRANSLIDHQINSFNHFILHELPEAISSERVSLDGKYSLEFFNAEVKSPTLGDSLMYPHDARKFNLTYAASVYCSVRETKKDENDKDIVTIYDKVCICQIPVMTRSVVCNLTSSSVKHIECIHDDGGVFIVKGRENACDRLLTSQVRAAHNNPMIFESDEKKYSYSAETRSISNATGHSVLSKIYITKDNRHITISIPRLKENVPVGWIFKAMGFTRIEDIRSLIGLGDKIIIETKDVMQFIEWDCANISTQDEALETLSKKTVDITSNVITTKQIIDNDIFPHLGVSSTAKEKAIFLGFIINKLLLTVSKKRKCDDRDNVCNKRVEAAGTLCAAIFTPMFKKSLTQLKDTYLEKRVQILDVINHLIKATQSITKVLTQCFSTGNWSLPNTSYSRVGVSQLRDCMTWAATLSIARRVITPVAKVGGGVNAAVHQIHHSQWGFECPNETPEGKKAGVVANMAIFAGITRKLNFIIVRQIIENKCKKLIHTKNVNIEDIPSLVRVFLNGCIIGFTSNPVGLVKNIHARRLKGELHSEISACFNITDNIVLIFCDEGRFYRLVFLVDNSSEEKVKGQNYTRSSLYIEDDEEEFDWNELVKSGAIVNIDCYEQQEAYIAMYPSRLNHPDYRASGESFTHCEIRPEVILGVIASMIPWPDHSQSPRNTYICSMAKQAIGIPFLTYRHRTDTVKVMHNPHKAIVSTLASRCIGYDDMPAGMNCIVAIMAAG